MPGKSPPSAIPSSARTAAKDENPVTNPRHIVKIPHTAVRVGSQILGETFFSTKLLGSSLCFRQIRVFDIKNISTYLAMYVA